MLKMNLFLKTVINLLSINYILAKIVIIFIQIEKII